MRDISVTAASSARSGSQTPSTAELAESSIATKRLSASTSHLGARNVLKSSKGPAQAMGSKPATDADGKN